jgi:hypothetical protein
LSNVMCAGTFTAEYLDRSIVKETHYRSPKLHKSILICLS